MKAKYEPRIDLANRTRLETVIPIKTPFVVFVDPSDACNFRCCFCPSSDISLMKAVNRPLRQMDFDLFRKIANDLLKFPEKVEVLRLYKDGEPLLNKNIVDMVKYAKDNGVSRRIDITTNASLLTKDKGKALSDAGLDLINISVYGISNEHYRSFSGVSFNFNKILENVRNFYENRGNCKVLVKINGDTLTSSEKKLFLEYFGDIADKIHIEHIMSCWPQFELRGVKVNSEKGIYGQEIKEVDACPYPFYSMSINSDGLASVCFLDWGRKMLIGDATVDSVPMIWSGQMMKAYQKMFLEGKRKKHNVCGRCGQMSHGLPDDIDQYKEILLQQLNSVDYFQDVPELV